MAFESALRSDRDMTDAENVKDARFKLERCVQNDEYAWWARTYGAVLCAAGGHEDLEQELLTALGEADQLRLQLGRTQRAFTMLSSAWEKSGALMETAIEEIGSELAE